MKRTAFVLLAGLAPALAWAQAPAPAQPVRTENAHCPAARVPPIELPRVKAAIRANQEVVVVALGSSSTEGSHSTDLAHTYPALLQAGLNAALPASHVAVLNRGVGGQDVTEMLPRLERDVLDARPTLVIWQVGANGAMKHMQPELFRRLLASGVQRFREAKIDVVLMDNQRAPAIMAMPDYQRFDRVMAEVSTTTGVPLFDRGALMDAWREAGFGYDRFMSDDGVHHNDFGYRCVAEALSQSIVDGLSGSALRRTIVDRSPK